MKRSPIAAFLILLLFGSVQGAAAASTGALCQSGEIQITDADAFDLSEWSEACWEAGDVSNAAALLFLSELRRKTDSRFLDDELADSKSLDLRDLENKLWVLLFARPDAFAHALNRSAGTELSVPPIYMPRVKLLVSPEDYRKELHFQFAAIKARLRLDIEMARMPESRDILNELTLLLNGEKFLSSDQEERIADLQQSLSGLWNVAAQELADRIKASDVETIVRGYGRYRPEGSPYLTDGKDTPLGLFLDFDDFIHLETTERIPVQWAESFGLEVDLAGVPIGAPVQIEWSLEHEALPGDDGRPTKQSGERFARESKDGTLSLSKFLTFVEDVPVACGPWQIELRYEGESIVQQSFFVYGCD